MNSLLAFSTANKNNSFPFWNRMDGTFGTIVYSALKQAGIDPTAVYIDAEKRLVRYNGKKRIIKGSFNCNNILKFVNEVKK